MTACPSKPYRPSPPHGPEPSPAAEPRSISQAVWLQIVPPKSRHPVVSSGRHVYRSPDIGCWPRRIRRNQLRVIPQAGRAVAVGRGSGRSVKCNSTGLRNTSPDAQLGSQFCSCWTPEPSAPEDVHFVHFRSS